MRCYYHFGEIMNADAIAADDMREKKVEVMNEYLIICACSDVKYHFINKIIFNCEAKN